MTEILLTSEEFVKSATNASDNINTKVMQTAIREAQEIELKSVVGTAMLNKLKTLVDSGDIELDENSAYKELLNESQYFLAYTVLVKLCMITTFKIDNIGVSKTSDDNIESLGVEDTLLVQNFYQKKADYFQGILQDYILANRSNLPEIGESKCFEIKANLYSAASGGLWLGGVRGKGWNNCYKGK